MQNKMNYFGDSSKPSFALPTAITTASVLPVASAVTSTALGATTTALGATSSPFSLGAGDPGAAVKAAQTPVFPLESGVSHSQEVRVGALPATATSTTITRTSTTTAPTFALTSTQPPNFSLESGLGHSLTALATTSASTTITPTTTAITTSAPTFGLGSTLSFPQPATNTTFTTASTTFTPASTTFTAALTSIPAVAATTTGQTTLGTTTIVTNSSAASSSLNFCQLEEAINKWTLELEEQEKSFMNQASQVNAWDRLLIANGEKIINLNNAVEQVKLEQQQLDHELDFILAQQRELEDLLTPLEKDLETNGVSDPEREHTYQLAENLDTQLKQMSEDLKEIVEHINETNRSQDNTDPIVQIGRILNAHMNSLQWIDQNTTLIGSHLDQVAKLHEVHRRENERSFRLTYD